MTPTIMDLFREWQALDENRDWATEPDAADRSNDCIDEMWKIGPKTAGELAAAFWAETSRCEGCLDTATEKELFWKFIEAEMNAPATMVIAPAAALAASRPSPLRAMYHEWQATKDEYNANAEVMEPNAPEQEAIFERMIAFEEEVAALVPETMDDFALKVIFADDDGDMSMNDAQKALAKMAYEMAGIAPGNWHRGFATEEGRA
jgi:hypothetical protein